MAWSKPETEQIRDALRRYAPELADERVEFLAEGWEFWAFRVGEYVLRFPKAERGFVWKLGDATSTQSLLVERSLTPALAPTLPVPISVTNVYAEFGPNGAPFAGHRFLPGEVVMYASARPDTSFGRDLGGLIVALHRFPAQKAVDLGVPHYDGARLREDRVSHYESVIRLAFPLISCEARTHVERVYETYLNDAACFEFEPVLVHSDLAVNTLVGPSGKLCGLIDFGDAAVTSPAVDFWLPVFGFRQLGISEQQPDCVDAAGIDAATLRRMMPELEFLDVRYPLLGILHGLRVGDDDIVSEGVRELNALLPPDLRCE